MTQVDQIRLVPVKAKGSQRNPREFRNVSRPRIVRGGEFPQIIAHTQFVQDHGQTPSQITGVNLPTNSNATPVHHYRVVSVGYEPAAKSIGLGGRPKDSFPFLYEDSAGPSSAIPLWGAPHTGWNITDPNYSAPVRLTGESEISGEQSTALMTLYGLLQSGSEEMPHDSEWILGPQEALLATYPPDLDLEFPHRDRSRSMMGGGVSSNILGLASAEFETPVWPNPPQSITESPPLVSFALVDSAMNSSTVTVVSLSHPGRYVAPLTPVSERIGELILEEQGDEDLLLDRQQQASWLKQVMAQHWGIPLPQPFIGFDLEDGFFIASWQSDNECNTLTIDAKERIGWYDPWPTPEDYNPMPEEVDLEAEETWERLRSALITIRR